MDNSALLNSAGIIINAANAYPTTSAGPEILNACPGRINRPLLIIAPDAMQNTSKKPSFRSIRSRLPWSPLDPPIASDNSRPVSNYRPRSRKKEFARPWAKIGSLHPDRVALEAMLERLDIVSPAFGAGPGGPIVRWLARADPLGQDDRAVTLATDKIAEPLQAYRHVAVGASHHHLHHAFFAEQLASNPYRNRREHHKDDHDPDRVRHVSYHARDYTPARRKRRAKTCNRPIDAGGGFRYSLCPIL